MKILACCHRIFWVGTLPILLAYFGLAGCSDTGGGSQHADTHYYHTGFHDPYYYGVYDYDDYDPVIVPPIYNTGNKPSHKPDRPGSGGDRPGNGLRPSHPIAGVPDIGNRPNRPSASPTPRRSYSIPSRARPASMGRMGGMRSGGMRGGRGRR